MADLRTDLADLVAALTEPVDHVEHIVRDKTVRLRSAVPGGPVRYVVVHEQETHRVRFPPLLVQLATAIEPSSSADAGARGYESSPSARIDAIDRLLAIEAGAAVWVVNVGGRLRDTTSANLRALVGGVSDVDLRALVADARRWVTWARVVTGWDTPPRRLRQPCMACGVRGGVRVRLDPVSASCLDCGATWAQEDGGIDVLAAYVRWCNNEAEEVSA